MKYQQPVIICGMHRSGTSLVSKLIESQGVFMGNKKQSDYEAVFFLNINEIIFQLLNASWDTPDNFTYINDFLSSNIHKIISKELHSYHAMNYFGVINYFRNHDFQKITYPWGWKDPRNTFTLAYWYQLFPGAKIVHVYRNPVDVASSLRKRQTNFIERFSSNTNFEKFAVKNNFLGTSFKCLHLNEGFNLWEKYVQKAFDSNFEMFHLKYEDLLASPEKSVDDLLNFIGILKKSDSLEKIISDVNASRKYAFIGDRELEQFYLSIKDKKTVTDLGYDNIIS